MTPPRPLTRRAVLGTLAALALPVGLAGCGSPLPLALEPAPDPEAAARLQAAAEAHGLDAYRRLTDINVAYAGRWRPFVDAIQPEVVDAGHRGGSQERLMPHDGIVAQSYAGPAGRKQVVWQRRPGLGTVAVWFDGAPSSDAAVQDASALVAECYGLFLLGPLWLADRGLASRTAGTERVDGRLCDVIEVWAVPGLGRVALDRVALCIDRGDGLVHRMRFTLEGFSKTQGAVAEVDTFEHERRFGVVWPMRSFERIAHPFTLPAHDWHITGLDVNRGYAPGDLTGPSFTGAAARPAAALRAKPA